MGNKNSRTKKRESGSKSNEKKPTQTTQTNQNDSKIDDDEKGAKQNEIKIHVIQARKLIAKDASGTSDPYCVVHILDQKYKTGIRYRDRNPVWNETFQITAENLFKDVKEISFLVYDKDKLGKDELIGSYKVTFDQINTSTQFPPQWYDLKDKHDKDAGQIQVQFQFIEDIGELSVRNFTHILQFTIQEGKGLKNLAWIGKSDPYVSIEWGCQQWKTKSVKGTDNPKWNETLYVFVDEKRYADNILRCSILNSEHSHKHHIATGYIHAKSVFQDSNNNQPAKYNDPVKLTKKLFNLDKKLADVSKDDLKEDDNCGEILVEAILYSRKSIEEGFYTWLIKKYDINGDGYLEKDEVKAMFAMLKMDASDDFFNKFDKNGDGKLDPKEVVSMLGDAQFQDSDLAPQLMLNYLRKDDSPLSSVLMTGFSRAEETNHRKVITLKDRKTGLLVQENIPSYIWMSMRLLYDNKTGRLLTHNAKKVLTKMSKEKGEEYDKPHSAKEIPDFIKLHGLDCTILTKDPKDFQNFNDFFARAIKLDSRPMSKNENEVVSPADCRMMLFSSIYDAGTIWVKGDKFNLENLLGPRHEVASKFEGGCFCIARLAPQDYHRFHWPVSGTVKKITPIDGALYTVNPVAVNKPLNVYTENKRCVVELASKTFGNVIVIAVAATMVGSYKLFKEGTIGLEVNMEVARGDVAGEFRFGGSTVLLLFEPNKIKWSDDILKNSNHHTMETLLQCRETIGYKA